MHLAKSVSSHLGANLSELRLTEQEVKAMIALCWEPLKSLKSLSTLSMRCGLSAESSASAAAVETAARRRVSHLCAILADDQYLPKLASIDAGIPATLSAQEAKLLATASAKRKGLRLCAPVQPSLFSSLTDADAVLVAATLRGAATPTLAIPPGSLYDECQLSTSKGAGARTIISVGGPSTSLAQALAAGAQQAGGGALSVSNFPKELASHLRLAAFEIADLRSAKFTTGDLVELGFPAGELAAAGAAASGSGSSSIADCPPAVLRELSDHGLALELAATAGSPEASAAALEALRAAGCANVPTDEQMEDGVYRSGAGSTVEVLKGKAKLDGTRQQIDDAQGGALVWACGVYAGSTLTDLALARNSLGPKTASAIAMLLRCSTTLTSIDLHENKVDDAGAALIAKALAFSRSLKMLRLSSNALTANGAIALQQGITKNATLTNIVLEQGSGTTSPGLYLPPLKGLEPAHSYDMNGMRFGPLTLEVLSRLITQYHPDMTHLRLDSNPVGNAGMAAICEMLKTNDDIKELHMRYCGLGASGTQILANALKANSSVEVVVIIGNQIGDEGARALCDVLPHTVALRSISLQDNLVSPPAQKTLREAGDKKAGLEVVL